MRNTGLSSQRPIVGTVKCQLRGKEEREVLSQTFHYFVNNQKFQHWFVCGLICGQRLDPSEKEVKKPKTEAQEKRKMIKLEQILFGNNEVFICFSG